MKRHDNVIDVDVDDNELVRALAELPDRCRSLNPFLRCTVSYAPASEIPPRLRRRISDIAVLSGAETPRGVKCVSVAGRRVMYGAKEANDPKIGWILDIIIDLLNNFSCVGAKV